jgi:hypothetical protein
MEFLESHFIGCSIVFILTLLILCTTTVAVCEIFAKTFKSYLDHKRFLETFLVTQAKEDRLKEQKHEEKTN